MKNIQKQEFDIYKALLPYCKKMLPASSNQPRQIDYITLQKDLETFHESQKRVCEEIVDVVDKHLEEFYDISTKMESIQSILAETDDMYSKITSNVDELRGNLLKEETKLKSALETYELKELETSLLEESREALQFLLVFNESFQRVKNKDYYQLSKKDKNTLIKFSYKLGYMRKILSHHLVRKHIRGQDEVQLLESLELEFQTYISEQLIRLAQEKSYNMEKCTIRVCYQYLNKEETYFGIIQEHLIWNELRVVEAELLSNKTSIISSKDPQMLENFFKNLFMLVSQLPSGFPRKRIIGFLRDFLHKKQFNFLYTYTLPVFPIAFRSFCQNLHFLNNESIQKQILKGHKWNIKMWSDVRSQDILRKSIDDDLFVWLEVVFKKQNILEGITAKVTKTALLLIGRYCARIKQIKCSQAEYSQTLSSLVSYSEKIPGLMEQYLSDNFGIEQSLVSKLVIEIQTKFKESIEQFLTLNIQMVVSSTVNSLLNTSSFLNKVLNLKANQSIHTPAIVFKALNAHLRNYPNLTVQAQRVVKRYVVKELKMKHDKLRQQTIEYASTSLTSDQKSKIVTALEKDKIMLTEEE